MGNKEVVIGSGYDTHLEVLNWVLGKFKPNTVLEFGMGKHSTSALLAKAGRVISIEMQSDEWFELMLDEFGDETFSGRWTPFLKIGGFKWLDIKFEGQCFDLAFVDGHLDSRPECVNAMMLKAVPVILAHDTECAVYGWERVCHNEKYIRLDFTHPTGSKTSCWFLK